MSNLLAARSQMAMSLAFHIVFAVVGMGMPLLMALSEWRWLRSGEPIYLLLAKRWAKGTAVLFAVGAVSGTVLSFELGLLWPKFMSWAGAIIGMPFSLEGFAFFAEAIFLGVYLYGWDRISPRAHLAAGVLVAVSGAASGMFVVFANAWMNTPAGFTLQNGQPIDVRPMVAMFNPSAWPQSIHMVLAAYAATGFVVAGIHAYALLGDQKNLFHRRALQLALLVGGIGAVLQPLSGDFLGKSVARHQPVKFAATEGQFESETHASLRIGGWPDTEARRTRYAIEIPGVLSFLAFSDSSALVRGLNEFPRDVWPPVVSVHVSFQIMVVSGFAMTFVALWAGWRQWRSRSIAASRAFLWAVTACAPLGFIAIEAGWFVTELGRQPWIIQGVMRTADAVTPMPGLIVPFLAITLLYLILGVIVLMLLARHVHESPSGEKVGVMPPLELLLGGVMLVSLTFYVLLAGADYGGGVSDLLASGPRAKGQRDLVAKAIAPIWEANHVWLILVVVVLFTAFPKAYALISTSLHIVLFLLLLGIVLRGSAFIFRTNDTTPGEAKWQSGRVFAVASLCTPILLGVVVGALSSGTIRAPGEHETLAYFFTWVAPFPFAVGLFALVLFALLAAVYLTLETDDEALQDDFRRRAIGCEIVAAVVALAVFVLSGKDAPAILERLANSWWAWPLQLATALAALGTLAALWTRRFPLARVCAAGQVTLILWGWAWAQYPYLVRPELTIHSAAAPQSTMRALLWALAAGVVLLFPSYWYLFHVFKGSTQKAPVRHG